jgi:hypothetical protein
VRVEQQTSAVLAGTCFVMFTQLSTRSDMPGLLAVAWWILSVSIPILASIAILPLVDDHVPVPAYEMLRTALFFAATLGVVAAIACVFSHFRPGSGFIFLLVAAGVYQLQRVSSKRQKKEDEEKI